MIREWSQASVMTEGTLDDYPKHSHKAHRIQAGSHLCSFLNINTEFILWKYVSCEVKEVSMGNVEGAINSYSLQGHFICHICNVLSASLVVLKR